METLGSPSFLFYMLCWVLIYESSRMERNGALKHKATLALSR